MPQRELGAERLPNVFTYGIGFAISIYSSICLFLSDVLVF
jgi:hypothetical protein